jgi:hypothetical protein
MLCWPWQLSYFESKMNTGRLLWMDVCINESAMRENYRYSANIDTKKRLSAFGALLSAFGSFIAHPWFRGGEVA